LNKKPKRTLEQLLDQVERLRPTIPGKDPMTLRAWSQFMHLSITDISRILGLNRTTLNYYMSGARKPSIKSFNKIAILTDCRVQNFEYLVDEK